MTTKPLAWFEDNLKLMRIMQEMHERQLRVAAATAVCGQQDITCLQNLIQEAKAKGKAELPTNWHEKYFKGRR